MAGHLLELLGNALEQPWLLTGSMVKILPSPRILLVEPALTPSDFCRLHVDLPSTDQ
jgi:hypothetical protein